METNVTNAKTTCEAGQRSLMWGDAKPCSKDKRGKGLCNSHLAQLGRRDGDETRLTPLRGRHGKKLKDEVQLGSVRVERTVAKVVEALGVVLGADAARARYRGTQALAEKYASGDLVWAKGKDPAKRKAS